MRKVVVTGLYMSLLLSTLAARADEPGPVAHSDKVENAGFLSLGLERVGGFTYAVVSATDSDNSVSYVGFGVGGVTLKPYSVPRVGVDYVLSSGLTLGGALGFSRVSGSTKSGGTSTDLGSAFLYTLTP